MSTSVFCVFLVLYLLVSPHTFFAEQRERETEREREREGARDREGTKLDANKQIYYTLTCVMLRVSWNVVGSNWDERRVRSLTASMAVDW